MKYLGPALTLVALVYLGGHLVLRASSTEVWDQDGRPYVIFPAERPIFYYLYRPLSYVDAAITGTGAHIGPHARQSSW